MVENFQSWSAPAIVLSALPSAFTGVAAALFLTCAQTDAAELAATTRSLGPDDGLAPIADNWVVGCGYAAKGDGAHLGAEGYASVRIVRLSDGVHWEVMNDGPSAAGVIAISCTHLYLRTYPVDAFEATERVKPAPGGLRGGRRVCRRGGASAV